MDPAHARELEENKRRIEKLENEKIKLEKTVGKLEEDKSKLERLNLKNDYDLRTAAEAKLKPDQIPSGVHYQQLNVLADAKSAAPAWAAARGP